MLILIRLINRGGAGGPRGGGGGTEGSGTVASICHDLMSSEAFVCPQ